MQAGEPSPKEALAPILQDLWGGDAGPTPHRTKHAQRFLAVALAQPSRQRQQALTPVLFLQISGGKKGGGWMGEGKPHSRHALVRVCPQAGLCCSELDWAGWHVVSVVLKFSTSRTQRTRQACVGQ
jgi:hypothetical protein